LATHVAASYAAADHDAGQSVAAALRSIIAHYQDYVQLVCSFDPVLPPPTHKLEDLLAREEPHFVAGHLTQSLDNFYIGGNATLGGVLDLYLIWTILIV